MSTYVIGDVQGCYDELVELLNIINFDRQNDKLIFAGDIINKGPQSLKTINFIMSLKESAQLVLGNHELLFLAISYGYKANKSNSLQEILNSNQVHEIQEWICNQKMLININDCYVTHAGIPHTWSQKKAKRRALELESALSSMNTRQAFLQSLFYTKNKLWYKNIRLPYRWSSSANYLTRMRLINKHGKLNLKYSSDLNNLPKYWKPWFSFINNSFKYKKIIFGHWAALNGITLNSNVIALDTGCVYGGELTCYCIDNQQIYHVKSKINKEI